jgi:serine phosphatase RsbU (regulator of sigma subunit)/lipopolysaccharide biosynthesis regulator YciM
MRAERRVILVLLFFLIQSGISAQIVDSLRAELDMHLEKVGEDSKALDLLKQIFVESYDNEQFALEIAAQAMLMAANLSDKQNEALMHEWIAKVYRKQKMYYLAMDYYLKAVKFYQELEIFESEAQCYLELGYTYMEQNADDLALKHFNLAKNIYEKNKVKPGLATVQQAIGNLYFKEENYELAIEQFQMALTNTEQEKSDLIAGLYLNIARAYIQNEDFEEGIEYLRRALVKYKLGNNLQLVAEVYVQYGEVYIEQKDYKQALLNYENALFINREAQDYNKIAENYNKISIIHYRSGNFVEAALQAENALNYNNNNLEELENSYQNLSKANEKLNKVDLSLEFLKKYLRVHDQITEDRENKQFNEMQIGLELSRQEKEVELLKRDQQIQNEELKRSRLQTYFLLFGIVLVILFAYYYYINNKRTKKANLEIIRQKEELSDANKAILQQKELIQLKNKDIEAGIKYAQRIQMALFPDVNVLKRILPDSMVYFHPKDEISGDLYWYYQLKESNKLLIAAVDCTGHGVPGAFMSVLGNTLLNQIVGAGVYKPDQILNQLHQMVRQALHQDTTTNRDGMDMAICSIDMSRREIEFAGAKNPLVYFIDFEAIQLKGDMFSIGGIQRESERLFTKNTIALPQDKEGVFYLFTDGFQDQFGGEYKQKYTRNRLKELLSDIHELSFADQAARLKEQFAAWKGDYEQLDDVLILGFRL